MVSVKKWASDFDCCVKCGKTDFKHVSRGMCNSCYLEIYRNDPKHKKKIAEQKSAWHKKQDKSIAKQKREERYFDGKREIALERDNYTCQKCFSKKKLTVHHIDGNGRGSENPNNELSNLVTLCRKCHLAEHREEINKNKKKRWCIYLGLDSCTECGKSNLKHIANGLCGNCYAKKKRKKKKQSTL